MLAHWNLILFCLSLKLRTFNTFPLTLDVRYEIQQLILDKKVYSIFASLSSSNIRELFLSLWFQVISFYSDIHWVHWILKILVADSFTLQLLGRALKVYPKKSGRKISKLRKYFTPMFALAKMMFHIVVRCGNYARFAEIKLSTCVQLNPRLGLILFFYSWHQICCNCYFLHLSRNSAYKDPDSILLLELPEATCMLQRWLLKFAFA